MYFSPIGTDPVSHINTPDGEFVLYTSGTVKLPSGEGKDINDLLDEPIVVDTTPGNVFRVIGSVIYVAALKRDSAVVAELLDTDDGEPAYHSKAYLIAIDWRSWTRIWDRDLCLGGLTCLSVSDEYILVAGFRESYDSDDTRTVIARLDHTGDLLWLQDLEAGSTPHPTEIVQGSTQMTIYVDSFNMFQGRVLRFKVDMTYDGHVQKIQTL